MYKAFDLAILFLYIYPIGTFTHVLKDDSFRLFTDSRSPHISCPALFSLLTDVSQAKKKKKKVIVFKKKYNTNKIHVVHLFF